MLLSFSKIFLAWAYSIIVSSPVACFTGVCIFVASVSAVKKLRSATRSRRRPAKKLSRRITIGEFYDKSKEELTTGFVVNSKRNN
jgi:hypothetical protein